MNVQRFLRVQICYCKGILILKSTLRLLLRRRVGQICYLKNPLPKTPRLIFPKFAQTPFSSPEFWPNSSQILLLGRFSSENRILTDCRKFRVTGGAQDATAYGQNPNGSISGLIAHWLRAKREISAGAFNVKEMSLLAPETSTL